MAVRASAPSRAEKVTHESVAILRPHIADMADIATSPGGLTTPSRPGSDQTSRSSDSARAQRSGHRSDVLDVDLPCDHLVTEGDDDRGNERKSVLALVGDQDAQIIGPVRERHYELILNPAWSNATVTPGSARGVASVSAQPRPSASNAFPGPTTRLARATPLGGDRDNRQSEESLSPCIVPREPVSPAGAIMLVRPCRRHQGATA